MASELYRLQESQITALGEAEWWALTIYGWLHKFFAGLRENRPPHRFADAIEKLLGYQDDNYPPKELGTRLATIGFFINQVRIPVEVPWFACRENVSVLSSNCDSAHSGALRLWDGIRCFLQHEVLQLCPELGLAVAPRDAARCLMPHCDNLRRDLGNAFEFDLDGLADAIKRESQAAMEVCNASAFAAVAGRTEHDERKGEENGGVGSAREQPEADPNTQRREILERMKPAARRAYFSFHYVATRLERQPDRLQDREAYDWLKKNGIDADKGDVGELSDYRLRAFGTWVRQLRKAREPLGEQKYTRRAGRDTGRSIVAGKEIESQRGSDE